jgi:simple sugar transport system permease protein
MAGLPVTRLVSIFPPVLALGSAFLTVALGLEVSGFNAGVVFSSLLDGAGGDSYRVAETLVKACPLLFTGLSVALALHVGAWNIGAEGQFLIGALITAWVGQHATPLPPFLALSLICVAAMLGGALWAVGAAFLKNTRGVNEVISTIMSNFIALGLLSYCVHGPLMEAGGQYPQTDPLPATVQLTRLLPPTRLHLGLVFGLIITVGIHFLLFRTKTGLRLRAAGANPIAARFAGIEVDRQLIIAFALSGALAGLAGSIEVSGITHRVYEKFSPGYGYTAIVIALVGQRTPLGVLLAAVFFGALEAGSGAVQRVAGVSSVLVSVIQATIVFFLAAYSAAPMQRFLKNHFNLPMSAGPSTR